MRRSTKIVLVILGIVAVLWLVDFLISSGKKKTWEKNSGYYGAAEPPVRWWRSHLSGLTEPPMVNSY